MKLEKEKRKKKRSIEIKKNWRIKKKFPTKTTMGRKYN